MIRKQIKGQTLTEVILDNEDENKGQTLIEVIIDNEDKKYWSGHYRSGGIVRSDNKVKTLFIIATKYGDTDAIEKIIASNFPKVKSDEGEEIRYLDRGSFNIDTLGKSIGFGGIDTTEAAWRIGLYRDILNRCFPKYDICWGGMALGV